MVGVKIYRKPAAWQLQARERALEPWFLSNEVAELRKVALYRLRKWFVLQGRRNEVRQVMAERGVSRRDAILYIYHNWFIGEGYRVSVADYINYYKYDKYEKVKRRVVK